MFIKVQLLPSVGESVYFTWMAEKVADPERKTSQVSIVSSSPSSEVSAPGGAGAYKPLDDLMLLETVLAKYKPKYYL